MAEINRIFKVNGKRSFHRHGNSYAGYALKPEEQENVFRIKSDTRQQHGIPCTGMPSNRKRQIDFSSVDC